MPHKSRKEKIIAELRRKVSQAQSKQKLSPQAVVTDLVNTDLVNKNERPSIENNFVIKPNLLQKQQKKEENYSVSSLVLPDYSYIVSDLRRTFLLTGLIVLLEILLYWVLELNGIRIFK